MSRFYRTLIAAATFFAILYVANPILAATPSNPTATSTVSASNTVPSATPPTTSSVASTTTSTATVTTAATATPVQTTASSAASASSASPTTGNSVPTAPIKPTQTPTITNVSVTGSVDSNATGPAVFDGVNITLQANNVTDDNLLTPDGLHWSSQTQVIPITGGATGSLDQANFSVANGPMTPATSYSINPGDSGRITYVGQTLSGTDLDLVYTVVANTVSSVTRSVSHAVGSVVSTVVHAVGSAVSSIGHAISNAVHAVGNWFSHLW